MLPIVDALTLLALALVAEGAGGYPDALYRRIGHPVTWAGRLIAALDRTFNRPGVTPGQRRAAGVLAVILLLAATAGAAETAVILLLPFGTAGLILLAVLTSSLLAQCSLHAHVAAVASGLRERGPDGGRAAVAMIVGRDPQTLDEAAICRAAIESLAENFSDGVVAPAFWIAFGGPVSGALYKAVNTADSMIGHRTPRHAAFGWAAARLDDLVNLPAARLAALLLIAAASCRSGARAGEAIRAVRRDARRHRSPNAGWPEAAMAGALGLSLAGPRRYGGVLADDHWMGDGRTEATPDDIDRALALYRTACALLFGLVLALLAAVAAISFR